MSNIKTYENSLQDGQPIECYCFTVNGVKYMYTSSRYDVSLPDYNSSGSVNGTLKFFAEYIKRDALKPGITSNSQNTSITVSKDNPVAKLFQTIPPEDGVTVEVYRTHAQSLTKYDKIFTGNINQGSFEDSECKLTVNLSSWLTKELPNMMKQYFCNNVLFDSKCRLRPEEWAVKVVIEKSDNHTVVSPDFAKYPDGYFTGGFFVFNNSPRMVREHKGNTITLQYPFSDIPFQDGVIYPGCGQTMKTCATKFNNYLNFSGFPYVQPTDPTTTNVGTGVYWADSSVVEHDTDCYVGTISI